MRESDHGTSSRLRSSGRPGKRSLRTSAMANPTTVASATNAPTK